ncbi:methyltetrahydrofolate cobalamin methyltransferase [bacterium]|nr:methyltetrahydrofolate cobalamin methyltransferase [bacterium]MCK4436555.1 methyltetrahydrofolate cobalamin methyltransferase [bacterium]
MLVVGERINTSRKSVLEAVKKKDAHFIQEEAARQVKAGANMIDINAGNLMEGEASSIEWLVGIVQGVVDTPLCLDSPNPQAIKAGVKLHRGKALVNSITAEKERAKAVLPLVKEYKASVVALTMDEKGMPETSRERVKIARRLLELTRNYGIPPQDVYFDPLVRPVGSEAGQGLAVLRAIEGIMSLGEGVHTICGLSNISFGLPNRRLLNRTFLSMAIEAGLDAVILDPLDKNLMATLKAAEALLGKDEFCMKYITASREGELNV